MTNQQCRDHPVADEDKRRRAGGVARPKTCSSQRRQKAPPPKLLGSLRRMGRTRTPRRTADPLVRTAHKRVRVWARSRGCWPGGRCRRRWPSTRTDRAAGGFFPPKTATWRRLGCSWQRAPAARAPRAFKRRRVGRPLRRAHASRACARRWPWPTPTSRVGATRPSPRGGAAAAGSRPTPRGGGADRAHPGRGTRQCGGGRPPRGGV